LPTGSAVTVTLPLGDPSKNPFQDELCTAPYSSGSSALVYVIELGLAAWSHAYKLPTSISPLSAVIDPVFIVVVDEAPVSSSVPVPLTGSVVSTPL